MKTGNLIARHWSTMIPNLYLCHAVAVLLAFIGCYGVMPSLAILIGKAFQLEPALAAGLILVACINGAQASNLCKFMVWSTELMQGFYAHYETMIFRYFHWTG